MERRSFLKVAAAAAAYTRQGYLLVDTAGFTAALANATVRLNARTSTGSSTIGVYPVTDTSWTEDTLNWNNKPATAATPIATFALTSTTASWFELDITNYVAPERAAGRTKIALALKQTANNPLAYINSSENPTNPPELRLTPGT